MSAARTPLRLDAEACDGCGRCVGACRKGALKVGAGYIYVDWAKCDGCGKCADFCDREAIVARSQAAARADAPRSTPGSYAEIAAAAAPPVPTRGALSRLAGRMFARADADAGPQGAPAAVASEPRPAPTAWTFPEAVLVLVVSFALLVGAQAFFGAASSRPGTSGLVLVAYDSGLLALIAFFVLRRGVSPLAAFRLDVVPEAGSVMLALGLFVGLRVLVVGYSIAASAAGYRPPADGADLTTLFGAGPLGAFTTVLVVGLLGPVLEEVALRGVLLGALERRVGAVAAVALTAVAFSLLHVSAWSFVPLTALGLALGWLAVRSRSLWPAVILHVAYNALILLSAFRAAGHG